VNWQTLYKKHIEIFIVKQPAYRQANKYFDFLFGFVLNNFGQIGQKGPVRPN